MSDVHASKGEARPGPVPRAPAASSQAQYPGVAAASDETAPSMVLARVSGVLEKAVLVEIAGRSHAARQAASCLLSPEVGDVAMCSTSRLGIHVLHVLERSTPECATVSVPGAKRLVLEQSAIDVRTDDLDASAARARVQVEQLHLFSRVVSVMAGGFDLVADRIKRIARLETTSTGDSVRTVRNTDTLRAGHILHDASEVMSLRSQVAVIEARGDVRINGERITVG